MFACRVFAFARDLDLVMFLPPGLTARQAVKDLSKFQSLCEEVIDLDHLQESKGKQVRVRPSFHDQLARLGEGLDRARTDMNDVLRDVEKDSKVRLLRDAWLYNAFLSMNMSKATRSFISVCNHFQEITVVCVALTGRSPDLRAQFVSRLDIKEIAWFLLNSCFNQLRG